MTGTTVSHYRVLERLGAGGMGVIYTAQDLQLDRLVALKFLPPTVGSDPEAQQRFVHEARAASALDHPNICTIHEVGRTDEDQLFICMPLYQGETVRGKIERGPLKLDEAVEIAVQTATGLAKAHAQGMVHRDIKPANVMVTTDGIAKILDFGLAKLAGMSRLTKEGSTLGTAAYMSPEQARGEEVDARSDIWSLGVMLYEMVTGQAPFKGDYENAVVYAVLNVAAEPLTAVRTGVPMELERIVTKAMEKDPSERYQHVDEMLVDLRRFRKDSESGVTRPATSAGAPSRVRRRWLPVALPAALVLVSTAVILWALVGEEAVVGEPTPIAVLTFANQTGEPSYDYLQEAIPNLLITSLEQSRYLRVITLERMRDVLQQLGKGSVGVITPEMGFEVCRREGINAIVVGSYVKAGETFVTDAKVLDVHTKDLLKSASARGEGVQSILTSQIDELSNEIARGVGLSQQKIASSATPIAEVTTASMDAYSYFLRGREEVEKLNYDEGRVYLERAVELDSAFASAYLWLAHAHRYLLQQSKAIEAIEKAKRLSIRAPVKERLLIESTYADYVQRNPEKELALLEEMVQKYPEEKRPQAYLGFAYAGLERSADAERAILRALELDPTFAPAVNQLGYLYARNGRIDEALRAFERYIALSPGDANPFDSMGELYLRLGKLDDAIAKYREAVMAQRSFHMAYKNLAYVYALKEDYAQCLRWMDSLYVVAPSPALKGDALGWRAFVLRLVGREQEADRTLARLAKLGGDLPGFEAPRYFNQAWAALPRGDLEESRRSFVRFHEGYVRNRSQRPFSNDAVWNIYIGYWELAAGRLDSAWTCVERVRSRRDSLEIYKREIQMRAGLLEAEVLLARGESAKAIEVARRTPIPYPSMSTGWAMPFYLIPPKSDVIPRALAAEGKLDSAIAAYRQLLTVDSASVDRRIVDPKVHFSLALLCERAGRLDEAREECRRFLEIWNKADEGLRELVAAREQLARLESSL